MCTLILAYRVWPGAPLVVAANRDERLDRPAEGPAIRPGSPPVLAPRDLVAGGTWLGLNAAGVFCGLTNRFGRGPDPDRRSRGELVYRALAHRSALDGAAAIADLDASAFNPFHLLVADPHHLVVVWSDGEQLHRIDRGPGIVALTERSYAAAPSGREDRLRARLSLVAAGPEPSEDAWFELLARHDGGGVVPGIDGVCVHTDRGYGTRSSAYLRLSSGPERVRFVTTDGPPCTAERDDQSALAATLLAQGQAS